MMRIVLACIVVAGLFLSSGCSTVPKMPIKLDPNYSAKSIDTIVLMPIVDRRVDKKSKLDLENVIRTPVKQILFKKGYDVVMPASFSETSGITEDNVGEMNTEELSNLGPNNARTLLYVYVDDVLDDYIVLAYSYKIEATGSLIDKKDRIELWRDKGIGASGQGGLISGVFAGMEKSCAVTLCLADMFSTLPKCPVAKPVKEKGEVSAGVQEMARPATATSIPASSVN